MDGSEKITPLAIGKSATPRCFKGINSFPAKYRSNKKAWMTTELFNECSSITRLDDYVLVDTDIAVWGVLSDAEIVTLDHNNTESDEDESEELTPVTLSEAKVSQNKLRNFFLQNHIDADILQASFVLEKSIDKVEQQFLATKGIVTLDNRPYLHDLAPADFYLFPRLKSALKGKRITDITDIQSNVTAELKAIPKELFHRSFQDLYIYTRSQQCITIHGDYFEGQ
ncbi:uncharacterized protein TNCV_4787791 [Trichonephila clavipes]|nr:uncharacterized protein TNCV_4787791 [Trichonephila clavipes]